MTVIDEEDLRQTITYLKMEKDHLLHRAESAERNYEGLIKLMEKNGTCKRVYSDAVLGAALEKAERRIVELEELVTELEGNVLS